MLGVQQLRRLYLKARYGECATPQDAAAAERLGESAGTAKVSGENVSREALFMKTTVKWASALALGAAAWKICRDRKYPLAKGCPPMTCL